MCARLCKVPVALVQTACILVQLALSPLVMCARLCKVQIASKFDANRCISSCHVRALMQGAHCQ